MKEILSYIIIANSCFRQGVIDIAWDCIRLEGKRPI